MVGKIHCKSFADYDAVRRPRGAWIDAARSQNRHAMHEVPKRRWLHFRLRSLLALTLLIALPLGWIAGQRRDIQRRTTALLDLGGDDFGCMGWPQPVWHRRIFGVDRFYAASHCSCPAGLTDHGLSHFRRLFQMRKLDLSGSYVTDAGLRHLRDMPELETLDLGYSAVTDAGLRHLSGLRQLKKLHLNNTGVGDAGLAHLTAFEQLATLDLSDTNVTDAGVTHLRSLPELKQLGLSNTRVTDAALQHIAELPQLEEVHLDGTEVSYDGWRWLRQMTPVACDIHYLTAAP